MPRSSRNWPLHLALLTLLALLLAYIVGWPLAAHWAGAASSVGRAFPGAGALLEPIRMRLFEALIAAWFFAFGASLGSFLNVVVYRTPRGLSLLGSSFCPKCGHGIRWSDNLPVLGWLRLRGRCRDCWLPISPRYPLVELLTGLIVLGLAIGELFLDGANLPGPEYGSRLGVSWLIVRPRPELIATFACHAVLLCILLSWTLIRWDGFHLPAGYVVLALLFGWAMPLLAPGVHPVAWIAQRPEWLAECAWCRRLDTATVGAVAGAALGAVQAAVGGVWSGRGVWRVRAAVDLIAGLALIGLCLGWQAVVSIGLLAAASRVVVSSITGGILTPPCTAAWVHLTAATFLQIVAWRGLDNLAGWPGTELTPRSALVPVAASLYFVLVAAYVEQRRGAPQTAAGPPSRQ